MTKQNARERREETGGDEASKSNDRSKFYLIDLHPQMVSDGEYVLVAPAAEIH